MILKPKYSTSYNRLLLLCLSVLLAALVWIIGSRDVASAAEGAITCYELVKTTTCEDDPRQGFCQAYPGSTSDKRHCRVLFWSDSGKLEIKCPTNPASAGEFTWDVPPQTWCSDERKPFQATASFTEGKGTISGRYWKYGNIDFSDDVAGEIGKDLDDGFTEKHWIEASTTDPKKASKTRTASRYLRPTPGDDTATFSIGVVVSGYGFNSGGNPTDTSGGGVAYEYKTYKRN